MGAETVAPDLPVMVDAARAHKAQIVHRVALVEAALLHVLVLGGDQRRDGQQIGGRLAAAQHHIANAADERLDDVLDAVQLLLGAESCTRPPRPPQKDNNLFASWKLRENTRSTWYDDGAVRTCPPPASSLIRVVDVRWVGKTNGKNTNRSFEIHSL